MKKLADEILEMLVLDLRRPLLKLAAEDLVEDNLLSIAEEGRPAAGHLIEDHSEGPQVSEGARLGHI